MDYWPAFRSVKNEVQALTDKKLKIGATWYNKCEISANKKQGNIWQGRIVHLTRANCGTGDDEYVLKSVTLIGGEIMASPNKFRIKQLGVEASMESFRRQVIHRPPSNVKVPEHCFEATFKVAVLGKHLPRLAQCYVRGEVIPEIIVLYGPLTCTFSSCVIVNMEQTSVIASMIVGYESVVYLARG